MVETDILRLNDMSVGELKEMWRQYFDSEPIWKTKRFYIPRLAYRMQELAYGGVPEHIKNLLLGKTVFETCRGQRWHGTSSGWNPSG